MDISSYGHLKIRRSARGKRPLRNLTPHDKIRAIQRIHKGETKASVSRDIGVPESTLRGWCKNEQKLRFMCRQMPSAAIVQRPNLAQSCPSNEKINNFDVQSAFTMDTMLRDGIYDIQNFIDYNAANYPRSLNSMTNDENSQNEAIFKQITTNDLIKRSALPSSAPKIKKHFPSASGMQSSYGVGHSYLNKNNSFISSENAEQVLENRKPNIFLAESVNQKPESVLKEVNYSDSNNNVSSFINDLKMVENEQKFLGVNCIDDINNNFSKLEKSAFVEYLNNDICTGNNTIKNDNQLSNITTLSQWCDIFNASLSFMALLATSASITHLEDINNNDSPVNLVKRQRLESSTSTLGFKTLPFHNDLSTDSYYGNEPEDLSMRSKVSKLSMSSNSRCQSPAKNITSISSTQSDAES
ncbi:PREDICTED: protein distal antenna-related-like [Rhagoletis zephyria]|uniref:protein distal antenna-related-like n=1 Tax=Rhagoletis zephyria TaxID=28612 RepID=UPI000811A563|nr:PREDICTED: protein distal antenna-related-like [Rhagoletis zephyria]